MIEADTEKADVVPHDVKLNPFAHLPGVSSRITGLGGTAPGHDPTYVFHTAYVEVAPGKAEFKVRFEGLVAKQGTIVLRVHMLAQEEGAHAILVTSQRVQLNWLVAQHGVVTMSFDAFRGVLYALYASLPGDSDAEAESLNIWLDRPGGAAVAEELTIDGRTSTYGQKAGIPTSRLISLGKPTLALPVSQICTARQLREPVAHEWTQRLHLDDAEDAERWTSLYVAQVLTGFDMLTPGAAGLGFASATDPLVGEIVAAGGTVVAIDPAASEPTHQANPSLEVRQPQAVGSLPNDVVNFDFVWSRHAIGAAGSLSMALRFMQDVFARLRPGGLAVHTFPYNLDPFEDTIEVDRRILLRRRDVERIALTFISHGHEVAQFKVMSTGAPERLSRSDDQPTVFRSTMAGLITRKVASQF